MNTRIILFIATTLFLQSCCSLLGTCPETGRNVVCLVDYSSSIPSETMSWYKKTMKNTIINNLSYNDKMVLLPIDYGSTTASKEIFATDFSEHEYVGKMVSPVEEDKIREENFKKHKDSVLQVLEKNFSKAIQERAKYDRGTDIVGALNNTGNYTVDGYKNIVVVFSDMVHITEEFRLDKGLDKNNMTELIKKGDPIQLKNAKVLVLTGEQPSLSISKYKLLKKFWQSYFQSNNVELMGYETANNMILKKQLKNAAKPAS